VLSAVPFIVPTVVVAPSVTVRAEAQLSCAELAKLNAKQIKDNVIFSYVLY
jgi:hypothetical protein